MKMFVMLLWSKHEKHGHEKKNMVKQCVNLIIPQKLTKHLTSATYWPISPVQSTGDSALKCLEIHTSLLVNPL